MTDAVVYNPTGFAVRTSCGIIDAGEWHYIEDLNLVSAQIQAGTLVIAQAPKDPVLVNPEAQVAFEKLRRNRNKNKRNAKNSAVRDTKESEDKNKNETEA